MLNIVNFNGGLGNQIMEYIFMRHLDIIRGEKNIWADTLSFDVYKVHNGFELNQKTFPNIKINLLKNYFESDVWDTMSNEMFKSNNHKCISTFLLENGVEHEIIADEWFHNYITSIDKTKFPIGNVTNITAQKYYDTKVTLLNKDGENNESKFLYEIYKDVENVIYFGSWLTDRYLLDIKKEIEHELEFTPLIHPENIAYKDLILSSEVSIGVHVRRGDFVELNRHEPIEKYTEVIRNLKSENENKKLSFFIFSNDLKWCVDNLNKFEFGDNLVTFIKGNDIDARNYIDIQLMTYCDNLISVKNSSFACSAKFISTKDINLISI